MGSFINSEKCYSSKYKDICYFSKYKEIISLNKILKIKINNI